MDTPSPRASHPGTRIATSLVMPEKETLKRAKKDKQEGKAPSTQAGEFVREEMHHIREGKQQAEARKNVRQKIQGGDGGGLAQSAFLAGTEPVVPPLS